MTHYPKNTALACFILFSLIAVMAVYWWGYESPDIGVDDANIYFVYMRNFAEGHGFVWNTGGERVEGFTSLIWTLVGALAYTISPAHFNMILLGANFLLIFFALRSLLPFSRTLNHTEDQQITATDVIIVSLLVLPLGFIEWGIIALMESGLWTFLIIQLTLQLCSFVVKDNRFNIYKFSIMIILLDLTRPESMVLGLVFIGILFFLLRAESGWARTWKTTSIPLVLHVATFAAIIAWRLSYFGYPFPNTFYAKVSASFFDNLQSGVRYLFRFFYYYPHAAVASGLLVICCVFVVRRLLEKGRPTRMEDKVMAVLLVVIFAGLAQPVLTGGDHFLYSRFYQPYLPLMYLAVTSSFLWTEYIGVSIQPPRVRMIVLVLPIVFGAFFFSKFTMFDFLSDRASVNYNIMIDFYLAENGRNIGAKLNETFADIGHPSLGALATGGIAYGYKGKTIDLLGLNNTIMAHASSIKEGPRNHASFEKEGFWKLTPETMGTFMGAEIVTDTTFFVLPENTKRYRTSNFTYLCYKGIFDDADFRRSYIPALVKNKKTDYFVFSYYRKDFLSSLLNNDANYFVKIIERNAIPSNGGKSVPSTAAAKR
jgi:arabinofuranosyltransferase